MRVYQYPLNRFAFLIVAALLVLCFGYAVITGELSAKNALLGGPFFVVPLLLVSWPSILGGAEVTPTHLVVRGWLRSRRIPRASILEITRLTVAWNDTSGRVRNTPLTMFWNGLTTWPPIVEHNEHAIHSIREALEA